MKNKFDYCKSEFPLLIRHDDIGSSYPSYMTRNISHRNNSEKVKRLLYACNSKSKIRCLIREDKKLLIHISNGFYTINNLILKNRYQVTILTKMTYRNKSYRYGIMGEGIK